MVVIMMMNALKEIFSIFIAGFAFPGLNLNVKPGLYPIGNPGPTEKSPVVVTANYFVTFKRVVSSLKKQNINTWLLVVDTEGINVWCSAVGGSFTAEKILSQIEETQLSESIKHSVLILPQLSAAGVDHLILKNAKWEPRFGPVNIDDLSEYLKNDHVKPARMSQVEFNVKKRIENSVSHNVFISLILIPLVLGIQVLAQPLGFLLQPWSEWLLTNILFLLIFIWVFGFLYGFLYPVIPFNSGILKGSILSFLLTTICGFLYFNSSTLDFVLGFETLLLYSIAISTDFNGFTPLWGTDFLIKDYIILTGVVVIIVLALITSPFLIGV